MFERSLSSLTFRGGTVVVISQTEPALVIGNLEDREQSRPNKFPAFFLLIPWSVTNRLCSCGIRDQKFVLREKFAAFFPEQGITESYPFEFFPIPATKDELLETLLH